MSSKAEAPKLCSRCGKNPRLPYQRWCRECHRKYSENYRKAHTEECRAAVRRWYAKLSPERREHYRQKSRDYYTACMADPERAIKYKAMLAEYYQKHKVEKAKYNRKYRQAHKKERETDDGKSSKDKMSALSPGSADTSGISRS